MEISEVRLDKFLWAIRIFKTRGLASEAIESGKIRKNGDALKPSKKVKINEQYTIRKEDFILEIEVLKLLDKRLSAPLVIDYFKELKRTDLKPKMEGSVFFNPQIYREKGKGRPTKRDRREIDEFGIENDEL